MFTEDFLLVAPSLSSCRQIKCPNLWCSYKHTEMTYVLTLNAPIAIKVVCFSRLLKCLRSLYGKQCGPRPVCSGSTLFASLLYSSVMLGNYLQQTTSADAIFRCIFLGALRVNNRLQELPIYHNRNPI